MGLMALTLNSSVLCEEETSQHSCSVLITHPLDSTGCLDEGLEAALGVQMICLQVTESGPRQLIDKWRHEAAAPNLLEAL